MKVCFIGIGSIAQRHIRNLRTILRDRGEKLWLDAVHTGKGKADPNDIGLEHVYKDITEMPGDYDAVFITNPTNLHYDTLLRVKEKSGCFFIEKPVFQTGREDLTLLEIRKKICYVACPLRYTRIIGYIKENIVLDNVYSIRCISSSYLPDWRPGIDHRFTYSADRDRGGGVELDLIHEWDYITYLFGFPEKVMGLCSKVSDMEINSNDVALYIAQYKDRTVEIHLDYFGRKTLRKMTLFMKEDTVEADFIAGTVSYLREDRVIELNEDRDAYQKRELEAFLDILEGKGPNLNDVNRAYKVLKLARGVLDQK